MDVRSKCMLLGGAGRGNRMHRLLRAVAMGRAVRAGRVVKFEEIHHNSLVCASNSCKMVLKGFLYNTVFRRNSTYAAFIVAGAVLGEKFLNDVVDANWRESNKGVRCLPHNSFVALLPCCLPHPSMLSAAPSSFHILFRNCSTTKSSLNPSERLEHLHKGAFENILLSSMCCLV